MKKLIKKLENELLSYSGRRLQTRRVDVEDAITDAMEEAQTLGKFTVVANHGGSVANAYNYPADTEAVVIIAGPSGFIAGQVCRLSANKVTLSGVIAKCYGDYYRPLFDKRFSVEKAYQVSQELIEELMYPL